MIELRAHVTGGGEVGARLRSLRSAVQNIRPALPAVVAKVHEQMKDQFRTEGARGPAGRWTALTPTYARRKAALFARRPILYLTGALHDSLTGDGPNSVVTYGANSVFVGTNLPYAEAHQMGTARMAKRQVIDPTERDAYEWVVVIRRHLEAAYARGSKVRQRLSTAFA